MGTRIIHILLGKYNPKLLAWAAFIIAVFLGQIIAYQIYLYEKEKELLRLKQEAFHIKGQLGTALRYSISATQMISFLVEKDLIGNDFDLVSNELLRRNKFIDALQLVKGNSIVKTYPLKGNEVTIGYEVLKDSIHRQEAYKALQRRELYFEGPIPLMQGGVGIVGRLPIIKDNQYWGFAAVVIRMQTLLKAIGLDSNGNSELFSYQIEKMGLLDANKKLFFDKELDKNSSYSIFEPIGDWTFYISSRQSNIFNHVFIFSFTWILLAFLWAVFLKYLAEQPKRLELLIQEKTKDLAVLNQSLEKRAMELVKSNKEIEQFAFSASHDLLEPLRMITSFLHQIEKKYSIQLDDKAKQYIYFATQGAERMRYLILDLLEFSLVGKKEEIKEEINLDELLAEVKLLLKKAIADSGAIISYPELGIVHTYRSPLVQVFLNLIENAINFCKKDTNPEIRIDMIEREEVWQFSVQDNGIGIDENDFETIFTVFKSLHSKDDYKGTGMGLSIVKKSVENIDGKIWLVSKLGSGSIFYFEIPK